jgi:hypothetical protein
MTRADADPSQDIVALLRIAPYSEPISGTVETSGTRRRFVGWMQLSALIEEICGHKPKIDSEGGPQ